MLPEEPYTPFEYEPGMFRANNNDYPATVAMSKVEGTDYWMVAMPLPSGHYLYNYKVMVRTRMFPTRRTADGLHGGERPRLCAEHGQRAL